MSGAGEARTALKWADGKVIKNEVDMQVCLGKDPSVIAMSLWLSICSEGRGDSFK